MEKINIFLIFYCNSNSNSRSGLKSVDSPVNISEQKPMDPNELTREAAKISFDSRNNDQDLEIIRMIDDHQADLVQLIYNRY